MIDPIPTPTFTEAAEFAKWQAMFNPPPYDPGAALAKAQALLPSHQQQDQDRLPLALISANAGMPWLLDAIQSENLERLPHYLGLLSSGEWVLAVLALHLFNSTGWRLPHDGLMSLRLLDDRHFELAMHAIRLHSRGLRK